MRIIHKKQNITECDTIEDRGEVLFPSLQLVIIMNEGSTVNVPHRSIEGLASTSKFFRDVAHGSDVIYCLWAASGSRSGISTKS